MLYILLFDDKIIMYYKSIFKNIKFYFIKDINKQNIMNKEIIDKDYFINIISKYLKDNKLKINKVKIVSKFDSITRFITYPLCKHKDLNKVILNDIEDNISADLKLYTFDYRILNFTKDTSNIILFAVETKILQSYIEIFNKMNIIVKSIDIYQNLILLYFQKIFNNKKILVFVYDSKKFIVLFIKKGNLEYIKEVEEDTYSMNKICSIYKDINNNLKLDEIYIENIKNDFIKNYFKENKIQFKYLDNNIFLKFANLF